MNTALLNSEIQYFIDDNLKTEITKLVLKGSPFKEISISDIAEQIVSKSKCQTKLPSWYGTKGVYYPNKINIEQTSSELTAEYKSNLIKGQSLIDLTGGFGVDSYCFSKRFEEIIHCEIDQHLSEIAAYNYQVLNIMNIQCLSVDGLTFLRTKAHHSFDWIYIDPSRRSEQLEKVFLLKDCIPNIPENIELILDKTNHLMIKLSPVLDISSAVKSLKHVKEVHVIAVSNEVKELILIIEKGYSDSIKIKTVNIQTKGNEHFDALFQHTGSAHYSSPKKYLYEPNAAILKAGLFNEVSSQLKLYKLHVNSHLYTSDYLILFPGRRFIIEACFKYNSKEIHKRIPRKKANITTRNFHETVAQIRKRTRIKDGGNDYLFFTTNLENEAIVIHCKKV